MKHLVKGTVLTTVAAFTLTACATEDGSLGENARTGAIAGAVLGGLVGTVDGGKPKNVVVGATIGAAVGAGLGNELDRQEADLRDQIAGSGATITNTGSELIVTLPEAVTFDTDSTFVRQSSRTHLAGLAENLRTYPSSSIDVIGHTDNVGGEDYNQNLSSRRANAVFEILTQEGVDASRIRAFGRGENEPLASNDTDTGRQQNRRVNVVITPTG